METEGGSGPRGRTALLVVDVQEAAMAKAPWRGDEVVGNIAALLDAARDAGVDIVYVQHDGEPGSEYEPATPGWEIHAPIAPRAGEAVVRKRFNSAFRQTELGDLLGARGVDTLVLVGMQTEYCIDTTCRIAFELGYRLVMPELTNTTFDNGQLTGEQIHDYHNRRIFAGRFASVPTMEEALREMRQGDGVA